MELPQLVKFGPGYGRTPQHVPTPDAVQRDNIRAPPSDLPQCSPTQHVQITRPPHLKMIPMPHFPPLTHALTIMVLAVTALATPANAIDKLPGEKKRLKKCERALCRMVLLKEAKGPDLKCNLAKTWLKSDIKKGGKRKVSWGFGDAQCTTNVNVARATILAALTQKKATVMLPRQKAVCKVDRSGEIKTVRAVLSPKLKTKWGKAKKLWINLKEIDGPSDIKATVWTAASLADNLGLFHRNMIKGINKFIHTKCQQRYADDFGLNAKKEASAK